jgi:hypothetical protein
MYDMLEFSLRYQEALDTITSDKEMKLQKYEMDGDEWEIAGQLCKVLKVSFGPIFFSLISKLILPRSSRT